MKNVLNKLLLLTFSILPVLCLTDTAKNALLAAVAIIVSLFAAVAVRMLSPRFIPENVKNIVILFLLAAGISVTEMIFAAALGGNSFLPLCAVSAVLLLSQNDAQKAKGQQFLVAAVTSGLFATLLLLIGVLREFLGRGTIFSLQIMGEKVKPAAIFSLPAGAIFMIALLIAVLQHFAKEDSHNA